MSQLNAVAKRKERSMIRMSKSHGADMAPQNIFEPFVDNDTAAAISDPSFLPSFDIQMRLDMAKHLIDPMEIKRAKIVRDLFYNTEVNDKTSTNISSDETVSDNEIKTLQLTISMCDGAFGELPVDYVEQFLKKGDSDLSTFFMLVAKGLITIEIRMGTDPNNIGQPCFLITVDTIAHAAVRSAILGEDESKTILTNLVKAYKIWQSYKKTKSNE